MVDGGGGFWVFNEGFFIIKNNNLIIPTRIMKPQVVVMANNDAECFKHGHTINILDLMTI